jgi:hypothetical protein
MSCSIDLLTALDLLGKAEAERDALAADVFREHGAVESWSLRAERAEARVAELEAAIIEYFPNRGGAAHNLACAWFLGSPCDCGLERLRAALAAVRQEKP